MERFFVDERGGCVAVRDRTETDPKYPGLHPDTRGVVDYWSGVRSTDTCPTCGHKKSDGWTVSQESLGAAHKLCARLNEEGQRLKL